MADIVKHGFTPARRVQFAGRFLVLGAALLACGEPTPGRAQTAATGPAPGHSPSPVPTTPRRFPTALWPVTRLFNVDRVDVRDIAARYGMKAAWRQAGKVMQLSEGGRVRIEFEDRNRDCYLDGTRIMLGETVVFYNGSLYVGKIDAIKTIAPLLRPTDYAGLLPARPKLIVLDAGHGGSDPGKQNLALRLDEKDMTLDVVRRLKKLLELRGYQVRLTRTDDSRLARDQRSDLLARINIANRARADLFLSIHFNAVDPLFAARVSGSETYVLTPQFQLSSSDDRKDDTVDKAYPGNRQDLANVLLGYQIHHHMLGTLKTSDRGYKRARYAVLCFAECPAALIEAAYLSNDAEARRVATPEFLQRIAEAIAAGVDGYAAQLGQSQK
ncbi:MAG: N-acetylmuramoyl-L-alanine amidase [Opitutaceae bacterium]|nr:N-acetylmuramoyl-L-alanine amidase [Opitutaceae bacterium]